MPSKRERRTEHPMLTIRTERVAQILAGPKPPSLTLPKNPRPAVY